MTTKGPQTSWIERTLRGPGFELLSSVNCFTDVLLVRR